MYRRIASSTGIRIKRSARISVSKVGNPKSSTNGAARISNITISTPGKRCNKIDLGIVICST
jgi:hypothetical protein